MEYIFHEKQDGSLCAKHCLNALLQGEYFTAVDLATLANRMDEAEREHMAEGGVNSEEYKKFLQQPSSNMDDSGYFSIQVIASALEVWNLELLPYSSQNPIAAEAQLNPVRQNAFICNYREHWFTIRKLGNQWFNLNSLLTGPELISDTYLAMFLAQLQKEGYSIFIVRGPFPECEADHVLKLVPAVQITKPKPISEERSQQAPTANEAESPHRTSSGTSPDDEDAQLQAALRLSLNEYENFSEYQEASKGVDSLESIPDTKLSECKLSLVAASSEAGESTKQNQTSSDDPPESTESIKEQKLTNALENTSSSTRLCEQGFDLSDDEEAMLKVALKMSMDQESS